MGVVVVDTMRIPSNAVKIAADVWACGDICCCFHTRIMALRQYDNRQTWDELWEGQWSTTDYLGDEITDLREEFAEACASYGLEIDLSSDNIWEWKAERSL